MLVRKSAANIFIYIMKEFVCPLRAGPCLHVSALTIHTKIQQGPNSLVRAVRCLYLSPLLIYQVFASNFVSKCYVFASYLVTSYYVFSVRSV